MSHDKVEIYNNGSIFASASVEDGDVIYEGVDQSEISISRHNGVVEKYYGFPYRTFDFSNNE